MAENVNKSTKERPSLLTQDEVETFVTEFGDIMHQTLTKARYGRFAGSATARDFLPIITLGDLSEPNLWRSPFLHTVAARADGMY